MDSWPAPYFNSFAIGVLDRGVGAGVNHPGKQDRHERRGNRCDPQWRRHLPRRYNNGFLIGGTAPGAGNLISGRAFSATSPSPRRRAARSRATRSARTSPGTLAIPNDTYYYFTDPAGGGEILANGASDITIGGTMAAARNIISGNDGDGILVSGGFPFVAGNRGPSNDGLNQDNTVEGNFIGIKADGSGTLPNAGTRDRRRRVGPGAPPSAAPRTARPTSSAEMPVTASSSTAPARQRHPPLSQSQRQHDQHQLIALSGDTIGNGSIESVA